MNELTEAAKAIASALAVAIDDAPGDGTVLIRTSEVKARALLDAINRELFSPVTTCTARIETQ